MNCCIPRPATTDLRCAPFGSSFSAGMGTESAWGAVSRCTITAEQPALNENTFVKAVSAESGRPFFTDAVKATEITSQASHSAPVQRPVRPATPSDRSPEGSGGIHRTGERQAACFSINAPRSSPRLRGASVLPAGVFRREASRASPTRLFSESFGCPPKICSNGRKTKREEARRASSRSL